MNEEPKQRSGAVAVSAELLVLQRQWRLICASTFLAVSAVAVFNREARPLYSARAVVSFDSESADPRLRSADPTRRAEAIARETLVLQSRDLVERAVRPRLHQLSAELGEKFPSGLLDRLVIEGRRATGFPAAANRSLLGSVGGFSDRLVVEYRPPSTWVNIDFTAYDQQIAVVGANALVDAYVEYSRAQNASLLSDVRSRAAKEVSARTEALGETYRQLTDESRGGEDGVSKRLLAQKLLSRVQDELVRAKTDLVTRRTQYHSVRDLNDEDLADVAELRLDQPFLSADVRVRAATSKLAILGDSLGDQHPDVRALKAELAEATRMRAARVASVKDNARRAFDQAAALEASLQRAVASAEHELAASEVAAVDDSVVRQQAATEQKRLAELVDRAQDDIPAFSLRVIQRADLPVEPVSPQAGTNLVRAIATGLIAGVLLSFLREHVDRRVLSLEDVREMGVSLLGLIPKVPDAIDHVKADLEAPNSRLSEAYRMVRVHLDRRESDGPARVFLVTSPNAGDGKTTTSASLAILMARDGQRVLLIDADLRRPAVSRYFGQVPGGGLAAAVRDASLDGHVHTIAPHLDLLTAGVSDLNPAEVLGSASCAALFRLARERYAHIICDAPPVLPVADAMILSPLADGMILVVSSGQTPLQALRDAVLMAGARGVNLIGVVLNQVDFGSLSYRHYGSYSHDGYGQRLPKKAVPPAEPAISSPVTKADS